ncbi:hypothetical protein CEXT_2531 [Caerostris extrusa]|uniref:Uncharacterized protein n=1 Tax=Caerostris extrusa TaxID=172846 RepID=A0AAV4P229_CAEEX|nr:hypothetical protein CEXT_2531 [Caerostris extrusa]
MLNRQREYLDSIKLAGPMSNHRGEYLDSIKLAGPMSNWNRTLESIEHKVTGGKKLEQKVLFDTTPDVLRTIRRQHSVASFLPCVCVPLHPFVCEIVPLPAKRCQRDMEQNVGEDRTYCDWLGKVGTKGTVRTPHLMSSEPFVDNSVWYLCSLPRQMAVLVFVFPAPFCVRNCSLSHQKVSKRYGESFGFCCDRRLSEAFNRKLENIEYTVTGGKKLEQKVLFDTTPDVLRTIRRQQSSWHLYSLPRQMEVLVFVFPAPFCVRNCSPSCQKRCQRDMEQNVGEHRTYRDWLEKVTLHHLKSLEPSSSTTVCGVYILFPDKWKLLHLCSLHPFVCEIVPLPAKKSKRYGESFGFCSDRRLSEAFCEQNVGEHGTYRDWRKKVGTIGTVRHHT